MRRTNTHSPCAGALGDLYLTIAQRALGAPLESFPSATKTLPGIFQS
jgi:hypothetical protein